MLPCAEQWQPGARARVPAPIYLSVLRQVAIRQHPLEQVHPVAAIAAGTSSAERAQQLRRRLCLRQPPRIGPRAIPLTRDRDERHLRQRVSAQLLQIGPFRHLQRRHLVDLHHHAVHLSPRDHHYLLLPDGQDRTTPPRLRPSRREEP